MDESRLYFIAVTPPVNLSGKVTAIKKDFANHYQTSKALKAMPHITLQQPFKRFPSSEAEMHLSLEYFFSAFHPFEIKLSGFGCFNKVSNKVIFIHVEENKIIFEMHQKLMHFLRTDLKFSARETPFNFHPHMTVAYRDLTTENFNKAWSVYKDKFIEESFVVNNVYLFKHNFTQWEVLSMFPLR